MPIPFVFKFILMISDQYIVLWTIYIENKRSPPFTFIRPGGVV